LIVPLRLMIEPPPPPESAIRMRLPEPVVVIGLVVEMDIEVFGAVEWNIEAPLDVLLNPAPALKVIPWPVTEREVPVKGELFVRLALKTRLPGEIIVNVPEELWVMVEFIVNVSEPPPLVCISKLPEPFVTMGLVVEVVRVVFPP